jgi:hypothetical protein
MLLLCVGTLAIVNFVRVFFHVVPPPRAISKMPMSVRAFNIVMQWPNKPETEDRLASSSQRSKKVSEEAERSLEKQVEPEQLVADQAISQGSLPESVEEDTDFDDPEDYEEVEPSKPKDLGLLMGGTFLGMLAALAVAGQAFFLSRDSEDNSEMVAWSDTIAKFTPSDANQSTDADNTQPSQQEASGSVATDDSSDGPRIHSVHSVDDFLLKYGERNRVLLVPEVDRTSIEGQETNWRQAVGGVAKPFHVYRFLGVGDKPYRTVWAAYYSRSSKKFVSDEKVAEGSSWGRWIVAWVWDVVPQARYLALELHQETLKPLGPAAIQQGDANMERLVQALGGGKQ